MYKRKKKAKVKARVSYTRRKVKRAVKRSVKRRAPMAKKKSTFDEPVENEDQSDEFETAEGEEQTTDQHNTGETEGQTGETGEVEKTQTEASDEGVYVVDSANEIAIKNQVYKRGDKVTLTPEELEAVQEAGVRILPAG